MNMKKKKQKDAPTSYVEQTTTSVFLHPNRWKKHRFSFSMFIVGFGATLVAIVLWIIVILVPVITVTALWMVYPRLVYGIFIPLVTIIVLFPFLRFLRRRRRFVKAVRRLAAEGVCSFEKTGALYKMFRPHPPVSLLLKTKKVDYLVTLMPSIRYQRYFFFRFDGRYTVVRGWRHNIFCVALGLKTRSRTLSFPLEETPTAPQNGRKLVRILLMNPVCCSAARVEEGEIITPVYNRDRVNIGGVTYEFCTAQGLIERLRREDARDD